MTRLATVYRALLPAVAACFLWPTAAMAQSAGNQPQIPKSWPDWLVQAMGKENKRPGSERVRLGNGEIVVDAPGRVSGEPEPLDGDGWYFATDIETDAPIECWVMTEPVDQANLLKNIASVLVSATAGATGQIVADELVYHVDAGAIGEYAFLAYETLYTLGEAPNKSVGLAKLRAATRDDVTIACAHNLLGYRETFERAFARLVESAEYPAGAAEPSYREIVRVHLNGRPVGHSVMTFATTPGGNIEVTVADAMLMPVDAKSVSAQDEYSIDQRTPAGELVRTVATLSNNQTLSMNLTMEPLGDGRYSVAGVFQEKDIETVIASDEPPVSGIEAMLAAQRVFANDKDQPATLKTWEPSMDPTAFIPVTMTMDRDCRKRRECQVDIGGLMSMQVRYDKFGSAMSANAKVGPVDMTIERLVAAGTPPKLR